VLLFAGSFNVDVNAVGALGSVAKPDIHAIVYLDADIAVSVFVSRHFLAVP